MIKKIEVNDSSGSLTYFLHDLIENDQPESGITVEEFFDKFTSDHLTEITTRGTNQQ